MKNVVKAEKDCNKELREKLEGVKERLKTIQNSPNPAVTTGSVYEGHVRRVRNAGVYLKELEEILMATSMDKPIYDVTKEAMNKIIAKADISTTEFDGEFCRLVLIQNFPYDDIFLLHMVAIRHL